MSVVSALRCFVVEALIRNENPAALDRLRAYIWHVEWTLEQLERLPVKAQINARYHPAITWR